MAIATITGLEILYGANFGDIDKERVVIRVLQKLSLSDFILVNANQIDDKIYDLNRKLYWFPSKIVDAGTIVRIYSKAGRDKTHFGKFKEEQTTFHDFFWGASQSIWQGDSNTAILVRVQDWQYKKLF